MSSHRAETARAATCFLFLLSCTWMNEVASQACTGVVDALGLQSAASNLAGDAVVNICNDIEISSTVGIQRPIMFVGQCPSPGCRLHATPLTNGDTIGLFQIAQSVGNVTFRNLWLDKGDVTNPAVISLGRYGGAIAAKSDTNLVADTVLFTNNRASYGGAVHVYGNATFTNCAFVNNSAYNDGGALYFQGAAVTVRNTNFTQNAAQNGGAINVYSGAPSTSIRGSLFLYNNATSHGGAIYVDSNAENVTIVGSTFANNTAYSSGGGIYDTSGYYTLITGNSFIQNYAPIGGGFALDGSYATVSSPNVFTRNSADTLQGGAGISVVSTPTGQSNNFCPSQPAGVVVPGVGGVVNSSCAFANCGVNSPCDPAATCALSGGAPTCTCPAGVTGSGWLCENRKSGLLAVGASNNFTVPPFVSLAAVQSPSTFASTNPPSPTKSSAPTPTTSVTVTPPSTPLLATPPKEKSSSKTGLIAGLAGAGVAALIVIGGVVACLVYRRKKRGGQLPSSKGDAEEKGFAGLGESNVSATSVQEADDALGSTWRRFSYTELQKATGNFSPDHLLGEGAFGKVYVATLGNGNRVAVKQLKAGNKGLGEREFLSELGTLGRVRHRNLVSLRGHCVTRDHCSIVLDYAANGNLDAALRDASKPPLDWETRVSIAVGAARGLSYLHNDTEPSILHRDIKSANILLDAKMQAQVADFGLAKLLEEGDSHQSTHVRGTYGYVAPEYALNGQVTKKSDVYSFGVVLMEIATGYHALEPTPDGGLKNLVDAVTRTANSMLGRQQPLVMMDARLEGRFSPSAATQFLSIALACCAQDELRRPDMAQVLRELESLARGEKSAGFNAPAVVETPSTDNASGDWFGPIASGSFGPKSGSTYQSSRPSHSTWSGDGLGSEAHQMSMTYQMSILTEGR